MASLPGLREILRGQLGDIAKFAKERKFQNELLEGALFEAIQAHNREVTWATLPPSEDQLVLLLAKSKIARNKALEYAADPKLSAGGSFSRDKSSNSYALTALAKDLQDDYEYYRSKINAQVDGEIVQGTLTRESRTRRVIVPSIMARPPEKAVIQRVFYRYIFSKNGSGQGFIRMHWQRLSDPNIAYMRVYLSPHPTRGLHEGAQIIRVIYDISFQGIPPLVPIITPDMPQIPQPEWDQPFTILPTGQWYLMLATFNWNGLHTESDPYPFEVVNSLHLLADSYSVQDTTPTTSTTTTTTTTTTTSTTTTSTTT